jgi:MFS family permease
MRGRFAWLGAGVVLLALGGTAAAATQDRWADGYGIIAYFLVPLAFIPLAAGTIASPRANRFVESLFTAPVERRDWFIAKILVLLTLAAAYYIALLPMFVVYVSHVPLPLLLRRFLVWTPGILVASVAIGTLVGVLFIGRSIAAPAATGMGVLLAYAALVPLQELMVARGNGATRIGRLTLVSPAVLLKNALGNGPSHDRHHMDHGCTRDLGGVRAGRVDVSATTGCGDLGGDTAPGMGGGCRSRGAVRRSGAACGYQLRRTRAAPEHRAGNSPALRARQRKLCAR